MLRHLHLHRLRLWHGGALQTRLLHGFLTGADEGNERQDKPLEIKAAYQRPCSNRLIPDKHPLVKEILDLIGVELPDRIIRTKMPCVVPKFFGRFPVTNWRTMFSKGT